MQATDLLRFWFEEIPRAQWWQKDDAFDALLRQRFGELHAAAARCELDFWRSTADGRLAEILVLDQLSRNLYRDTAQAFAFDSQALALAQEAIACNAHQALPLDRKAFLYMPFMHSESRLIHERALQLFAEPGMESSLDFERRHKSIIDRFGRYPHRNRLLGRMSTPDEEDFLMQPGSAF